MTERDDEKPDLSETEQILKLEEQITKLKRDNVDSFYEFYELGKSYEASELYQSALTAYDTASGFMPNNPLGLGRKGVVLAKLELFDEAVKVYDKVISIDPENEVAWYNRGIALTRLGRLDDALSSYDKAIEIDYNFVDAWNNSGVVHGKLGNDVQAKKHFDAAKRYMNDE